MIPVALVTGFLGSGKTTFLKVVARKNRDRRIVYLVNDFAAVDVDGELLRESGRQVVALAGGSIFCRCLVTECLRVLRSIADGEIGDPPGEPPEGVVIEASGMADPRVIDRMLEETRLDRVYAMRRVLALADPGTFFKLLKTLPNIRAQVAAADTVLITKADRYSPGEVEAVRRAVEQIRPGVRCLPAVGGEVELDLFGEGRSSSGEGDYAPCVDPRYHRFTLTERLPDRAGLEALIRASGNGLYRVKGFLRDGGQTLFVDYSSSGLRTEAWRDPEPSPRLACIADGEKGPPLEPLWREKA